MRYLLVFYLLWLVFIVNGQSADSLEFILPFYFEDNIGNKDTVYVGASRYSNDFFNPTLGELNLGQQPFDSIFEVRAGRFDELRDNNTSVFTGKKAIVSYQPDNPNSACQFILEDISFIVNSKHPPLTVSWDRTFLTQDPKLSCVLGSFITNSFAELTVEGWWEAASVPNFIDYKCLGDKGGKTFYPFSSSNGLDNTFSTYGYFPVSGSVNSTDTLPIFNIVWALSFFPPCQSVVDVDERTEVLTMVYPNPTSDWLYWTGGNFSEIDVFDLQGQKMMTVQNVSQSLNLSNFPAGVYLVKFNRTDGHSYLERIIKR